MGKDRLQSPVIKNVLVVKKIDNEKHLILDKVIEYADNYSFMQTWWGQG